MTKIAEMPIHEIESLVSLIALTKQFASLALHMVKDDEYRLEQDLEEAVTCLNIAHQNTRVELELRKAAEAYQR